MAPFRNKGWPYFDKMQDIMPNTSARGSNAFSAEHTAPPLPLDPEGISQDPSVGIKLIDIDSDVDSSTLVSVSSSKRKLDAIASEEVVSISSEDPLAIASSEPVKKKGTKSSSSITSSSKSRPHSSRASSSTTPSSQPSRATSSKLTSTKLSPAVLVHEMQGTISSLAAAVRESGSIDPEAQLRQQAVQSVSHQDGLSSMEKLKIIELFRKDYASVQTYLGLAQSDDLRKSWLQMQLE